MINEIVMIQTLKISSRPRWKSMKISRTQLPLMGIIGS